MNSSDFAHAIRIPINLIELQSWDTEGDVKNGSEGSEAPSAISIDIPFALYPKHERLGRIADWTGPVESSGMSGSNLPGRRPAYPRYTRPEDEDAGWSLTTASGSNVTGATATNAIASSAGPRGSSQPYTRGFGGGSQPGRGSGGRGRIFGSGGGRRHLGWGGRLGGDRQSQRKREPSIAIAEDWRLIEDIEFSRLTKLQLNPGDAVCVKTVGQAWIWDEKQADKISIKSEKIINVADTVDTNRVDASDEAIEKDLFMMNLAKEHGANILCSVSAAVALMTAPLSVIPWDIVITKRDGLLIIDKRPESSVGNVTAQENSSEHLSDETLTSLSTLATKLCDLIPRTLTKGVVDVEKAKTIESEPSNTCINRYAILDLGDENVMLIRSKMASVIEDIQNSKREPLIIAPLIEHSEKSGAAGIDWRNKLESQQGAVLAQIIRNNGAQLARFFYSALLNGISTLNLAYCSKVNMPKGKVSLLAIQPYEPYELASQMNLNFPNGFGILRAMVDLMKTPLAEGEYALIRDPNKPLLRLYRTKSHNGDTDVVESVIDELIPSTAHLELESILAEGRDDDILENTDQSASEE